MHDLSKFTITAEILSLIAEIDEFKGSWKLFGKLTPDRLSALKKVATIESIGSSTRIEGSRLSDSEIEKLLSNIVSTSFSSRDEQEVVGYAQLCDIVFENWAEISLTENVIKQFHKDLLKYSHKDEKHRGEYKKLSNNVEAFDQEGKSLGIVFETVSPFDTPRKMQELVQWIKDLSENKEIHPLIIVGLFVVVFLAIHPFQDGNGRLSRVLTTLLLMKFGYLYVPYSSLESVIEKNKESYYLSLRKTQVSLQKDNPDFHPWVVFFLRSLQRQKIHLENKIKEEGISSLHMHDVEAKIMDLVQRYGKLNIKKIEEESGINRNTIKKHLARLVDNKNLLKLGQGRSTYYSLF